MSAKSKGIADGHIHVHGNAVAHGVIQIAALSRLLKSYCGMDKSILDGLHTGDKLHATAGLKKPGEGCDLDYTMGDGVSMNVDVAISNSLGFGGHNASLIVKKFSE